MYVHPFLNSHNPSDWHGITVVVVHKGSYLYWRGEDQGWTKDITHCRMLSYQEALDIAAKYNGRLQYFDMYRNPV